MSAPKTCKVCRVTMAAYMFRARRACRRCDNVLRRESRDRWRRANREKAVASTRAWRARNPAAYEREKVTKRMRYRLDEEYRAAHLARQAQRRRARQAGRREAA